MKEPDSKALLSLILAFVVLLTFGTTPTAVPQDVNAGPFAPVVYSKGPYTVLEDGTLFYEGDIVLTCDDLPELVGDPELPSARGALETCAELGHLPSAADGELPATGGAPYRLISIALALAAGLALSSRKLLRVT